MSTVETSNYRKWLSDGILIALATLLGYLIAYRYESGYMSFFGVPDDFIEINLIRVLIAGFTIFSVLLTFIVMIEGLLFLLPKDLGFFTRPLLKLSPFLLAVVISLLTYGLEWRKYIFLLILLIIFSFLEFVFPLLSQKEVKGYREKLIAQDKYDTERISTRFISHFYENVERPTIFIFAIILFVVLFAATFGESKAMRQIDYLTINTSPEAVVIRTYGDKLICLPFDRKSKEFKKRFFVIKIADNVNNVTFSSDRVGPLHASISKSEDGEKK